MPLINVYCQNRGWLFEDLKQGIAQVGAVATEWPIDGADAYICIRTREFMASPKPRKTVVQVHDLQPHDRMDTAGKVSLVHSAQLRNFPAGEVWPIGSRQDAAPTPLPPRPAIGFFCREAGGSKGSEMAAKAVTRARRSADFDFLMVGERLGDIASLGAYEERPAVVSDYSRVTALLVCSLSPMVPLSAYETCASGRVVISTPREWPRLHTWPVVEGRNAKELAAHIVGAVKSPTLYPGVMPYTRESWCRRQVRMAISLL